jgi:purine-binding chemotaxis protein CheW
VKGTRSVSGVRHSAPIPWAEVHRRLEDAESSTERALNPSAEEKKHVLRERAVALAREQATKAEEESLEVVTFHLAYETYGIESRWVREIFPLRKLAPLPWCPPFVAGLMNVHGKILPVIDIKKLFDLPEKGLTDLNKVLIIHREDLELGILADQILEIRSVPLSLIQSSLPTLTGIREEYLKGVTAGRLVILDAEKVLTDPRLANGERNEW